MKDILSNKICDSDVDFWWTDLKEFMSKRKNATDWRAAIREGTFSTYLSDFLLHRDGGENMDKFIFERDIVCGEPASGIKVTVVRRCLALVIYRVVQHL